MNFLLKLTLFLSVPLLAAAVLSGCGTKDDVSLLDTPNPPAMTATPTPMGAMTNDADATDTGTNGALLQSGETVLVDTSTGSQEVPGPIASPGQSCLIADDGTISLPLIGTVQAAGKTPGELQADVQTRYVPQYYIRLTVTVTAQNRVYYVGGEVQHPGPVVYIGETTVTKAIQAAGDLTQFASHTVWLNRRDGTRVQVHLNQALRDPDKDLPVYPGDQIQVPRRVF